MTIKQINYKVNIIIFKLKNIINKKRNTYPISGRLAEKANKIFFKLNKIGLPSLNISLN